ncbi:efflux RND transporter periplasmic adaptor subunit [Methylophaga sp. OBS4]|uniref:efflux RND transporter periplasmic adaptor subunit n=1 Tax=Methylophaga sp. OBS4 TaxID=2991935 RepID=UPI002259C107|nr:efflux transporter periplasmic adaptor subunit [Methylophaga sp. OBS4]MCX4186990.1 efflux transporter periplasmic adaptor subunit [Methylophaga sp. OBS4]
MNLSFRHIGRVLMVVAGFIIGVVLLVFFVTNRQPPERQDATATLTSVTVIEARPLAFRLEARGHGIARPAETWQAVANVSGRVIARHQDLASGALLPEGTLLLVLDPSRYELVIAETQARLASLAAELSQLEAEETNTRGLLVLERERLALAEQELARIERLASGGAVTRAQLDEQRRTTLAQRQAVASLENTLALLPSRRAVLTAQRERTNTDLAQARRDLEDTRFVAPYDLRLGEVGVELYQFVGSGQHLFQADSLAAAEVEGRIPFSMLRRLLGSVVVDGLSEGAMDLSDRIDFSAITAELELVGAPGVGWTGRMVRVASGLDPATRTVRVVVRVDDPYRNALPPNRPPLQRDMYIQVRLSTESPEPLLAVPASAVHQGKLFLVDDEDRLVHREVEVAFEQGDLAVIAVGLAPGERVVVNDLPSAIQGMTLAVHHDEVLERRIAAAASGERP